MITLVADVGGTNTRVGVAQGAAVRNDSIERYRNTDYASLGDVLAAYQRDHMDATPDTVCVAVAGPVRHDVGRLTNRDWIVSKDGLCRATGATTGHVINDLSAQGYALDTVSVRALGDVASTDPSETRLVVGIGTGFNAAPVLRHDGRLLVTPSECGHVTLPVWDDHSARLSAALKQHHGFASVEDVLSGRGLPQSYRFLTGETPPDVPADILAQAQRDPTGPAGQTVHTIIGALGRVVGDLGLVHLPFGGIVLIGGMARALLPFFDEFGFYEGLRDKGRFSDFLSQFNIFVLEDDFAALSGCAIYAQSAAASAPSGGPR